MCKNEVYHTLYNMRRRELMLYENTLTPSSNVKNTLNIVTFQKPLAIFRGNRFIMELSVLTL